MGMLRWIMTGRSRPMAGLLAGVAVLWAVYGFSHNAAAAIGYGLAAFIMVALGRPQPAAQVRRPLPAVLFHRVATFAVYLLVLGLGAAVFGSLPAAIGFALAAYDLLAWYWPAPAASLWVDVATMAIYLALAAIWLWQAREGSSLFVVLAVLAAAIIALPRWAAHETGQERTEKPWPRLLGPRPLP